MKTKCWKDINHFSNCDNSCDKQEWKKCRDIWEEEIYFALQKKKWIESSEKSTAIKNEQNENID